MPEKIKEWRAYADAAHLMALAEPDPAFRSAMFKIVEAWERLIEERQRAIELEVQKSRLDL
jgi:hypothetical protein